MLFYEDRAKDIMKACFQILLLGSDHYTFLKNNLTEI